MTKQDSTYLKGWAVLFMMFLHFGCGWRIPEASAKLIGIS